MHLCTSVISLLGSIEYPDFFPPQILRSSTIPEVNMGIYTKVIFSIYIIKMNSKLSTDMGMYWGETVSPLLNVSNMATRSRRICANSQRREGKRWRLIGWRDEWAVDKNLYMIISGVQSRRYIEWVFVFPSRIPSHWRRNTQLEIHTSKWELEGDIQWTGTESTHLFNAESSSATICCSQCGPT